MNILLKIRKAIRLLPVAAILLLAPPARAQQPVDVSNTYNWGTSSWGVGTAANGQAFTVNGPYDAQTGAGTDYFYDAGSAVEITGGTAPQFYNLTLDNGAARAATISNSAGIDVAATLQLQNGITTVPALANAIRMGANATNGTSAFSATRYVDGYMSKAGTGSAYTYPLGTGGFYAPPTFEKPGGTTIRYSRGVPANNTLLDATQGADNLATVSSKEYYPVSPSNGLAASGSNVTLPFTAGTQSGNINDYTRLTIAGYDGTQWVNLSTGPATVTGSNSAGTVQVTLNRSLSGITMIALASTSIANPLPVKMVSFTAGTKGCDAQLAWQTVNEQSGSYYEVEHSTDAKSYAAAGRVESKGIAAGADYTFTYPALAAGTHYFRLRMVESSGAYSYSAVAAVRSDCSVAAIRVLPNPVTDIVTVAGLQGAAVISVIDGAGRQVLQAQAAGSSRQIDVSAFAAGIYFIRVAAADGRVTTVQVVKQ